MTEIEAMMKRHSPTIQPTAPDDMVRRLRGPVQWGYMCLADGGFIKDDTPVEAADLITSQAQTIAALREIMRTEALIMRCGADKLDAALQENG